jgi:hypothetical protein
MHNDMSGRISHYPQIPLDNLSISRWWDICSVCHKVCLDRFMEYVVYCRELLDFKYIHDCVCDVLFDVWVSVKKETPVNFLTNPLEERSTLRSADILLYEWVGGKNVCVDLTLSLGLIPLALFCATINIIIVLSIQNSFYLEMNKVKNDMLTHLMYTSISSQLNKMYRWIWARESKSKWNGFPFFFPSNWRPILVK